MHIDLNKIDDAKGFLYAHTWPTRPAMHIDTYKACGYWIEFSFVSEWTNTHNIMSKSQFWRVSM